MTLPNNNNNNVQLETVTGIVLHLQILLLMANKPMVQKRLYIREFCAARLAIRRKIWEIAMAGNFLDQGPVRANYV